MIDTNLEVKQKLFPIFVKALEEQLFKGAKKYKGTRETKEWSDTLMEFDDRFFLVTMMKYIGRVRNGDPRAKEDLSKIAVYSFLQWAKMFGEEELVDKA